MKAFIEKIVVQNFKSYGKRTIEIPIGEGFVAIVGPNGAGKSNIGDSISFALGLSSSKMLRAKNMSYLIFSKGGEKEEFADVEIHFKNFGAFPSEEENIVISRRVYKDGHTVFKINNKVMREKDVKDFLARAGIYQSAYNIILQGDIARFVNMSPLERRKTIEDIAGITEYEEKKQKALLDLGEIELKLRELKLLIEEIEFNLSKLQDEREKAKRFLELEDFRKDIECAILLKEINDINKRILNLKNILFEKEKDLNILKESLTENQSLLEEKEKKLTDIINSILPYKENIGKLSAKLEYITAEIDKKQREVQKLDSSIEDFMKKIEYIEKDISSLENELKELKEKETSINNDISSLEKLYKEKEEKFKSFEEKMEISLKEAKESEEKEKELIEFLDKKNKEINNLINDISQLSQKISRYEEEINEIESELLLLDEEEIKIKKKIQEYEDLFKKEKSSIEDTKKLIEKESNKLISLNKELEEIIKEKAILQSKTKDEETFLKDIDGLYGQIKDIITLKDEKFELAVSVSAGARINFYVVENEDVAKKCINILKERGQRASFIPLNKIQRQNLNLRYPRQKGAIDFVVNVIDFDQVFKDVIYFVFGDTLIVESFEDAKALGIGSYRMVSLEGDLFEKSGVITGGKISKEVRLGSKYYKEKLADLQKREEEIRQRKEALEKSLQGLKEKLIEKEGVLKISEKYKKDFENKLLDITNKRNSLKDKKQRGILYIEDIKLKLEQKKTLLHKEREEIVFYEKKLENLQTKRLSIIDSYISSGALEIKKELDELLNNIKLKEKALNELRLKINDLENNIKSLINSKEEKIISIDQSAKLRNELINDINSLTLEKNIIEEEIKKNNGAFYSLYKEKEAIEKEISDLNSLLGSLKIREEALKEEISKINVEISKEESRVNSLQESLQEKGYDNKDLSHLIKESKLKEKLGNILKEIESIGPVNLKSFEDYEELDKRYKDYKERLEKLTHEKSTIKALIDEIDTKKYKVFMEAFRSINSNFKRIYASISFNGRAFMSLENEEDPFKGGINITVKPRGKDVQYVEAISGGEKTIAALSLIFAIQDYSPSIFYYFDEVDAHLDEANATLLGNLIKERSKKSQFIVVTLREGLAKFANRFIGVSAKDGISRVFTLRSLEEAVV